MLWSLRPRALAANPALLVFVLQSEASDLQGIEEGSFL